MQKRTVPLSLIISAALSIPSLAMAVSADIENDTAMDMNAVPTQDMMQNQAENPNVEPFSTQAEVAPRDPEMQAYDEPYNDQSNDPNSDLNNDSNYQAQTADADVNVTEDANTADMNPTDMNNADMNNVIVEEMPQSELENPNAELMATQPAAVDSTEFEAVADNEVAVTNPEMQAYDEPYNDQSNDPNSDLNNDSNYQAQTADADVNVTEDVNPTDMNNADMNNADMNNVIVEEMPQSELENPNAELMATQPAAVDSTEFEAVADNEVAVTNPEMQAQNDSSAPNQQHSSPDYQPLITGETDDSNVETASTLQEKTKDKRGELLATQPAEVEISEERFMVSR